MLILNFSHPLTDEQKREIEEMTGQKIEEIKHIPTQFDNNKPFASQIEELVKMCGLTPEDWQSKPILIVPPSFNFIAVTLLAALHGVMGYFPPVIRLKPLKDSIPPKFIVAEIINLQSIREKFRESRR